MTEKRALAQLEEKCATRQTLDQRIANLRKTNDANRSHLATTGPPARHDVVIGDADSGLTFDASRLPVLPLDRSSATDLQLTPEQEAYIDSLPSANILEARLRAYTMHNAALDEKSRALRGRSFKLETKLRRLIALSTGTGEALVDDMLGPLRDAVESEGGEEVDYLRLREFLRKVA